MSDVAHSIRVFTAAEHPIQLQSVRIPDPLSSHSRHEATTRALDVAREHGLAHTRLDYLDARGRLVTSKRLPVPQAD